AAGRGPPAVADEPLRRPQGGPGEVRPQLRPGPGLADLRAAAHRHLRPGPPAPAEPLLRPGRPGAARGAYRVGAGRQGGPTRRRLRSADVDCPAPRIAPLPSGNGPLPTYAHEPFFPAPGPSPKATVGPRLSPTVSTGPRLRRHKPRQASLASPFVRYAGRRAA